MKQNISEQGNEVKFIVSACNRKAYRLCFEMAINFYPVGGVLFVQGKSSCGKSRLLQETAECYYEETGENAIIVSLRLMTEEFVRALKTDKISDFINRYLSNRLLLIDDAESIMGFLSTQEAFADIFRKLTKHGVNIIIFSEYKLPRFEGMYQNLKNNVHLKTVEMGTPDIFLRVKLLKKILRKEELDLPLHIFRRLIFSKNIGIGAFNGCVSKIRLVTALENEKINKNIIDSVLREYED